MRYHYKHFQKDMPKIANTITKEQFQNLGLKISRIKSRCKNTNKGKFKAKDLNIYKDCVFDEIFLRKPWFMFSYFIMLGYHKENSSLDRIDSTKGYEVGNMRVISKCENETFNKEYLNKVRVFYFKDINLYLSLNQRSLYQGIVYKRYLAKILYHKGIKSVEKCVNNQAFFKDKISQKDYEKLKEISAKNKELIDIKQIKLQGEFDGVRGFLNVI